jgi:hypothetical protein
MAVDVAQERALIEAELTNIITALVPNTDFSEGTVLKELIINPAAIAHSARAQEIGNLRTSMSLVQVLEQADPDPTLVNNLLANFNIFRREGSRATGTLNIFTRDNRNIFIPQTAVFTCAGITLEPTKGFVGVAGEITTSDTDSIGYIQMRQFDDETLVFSITAITVENIETVLSPGLACTISPTNSLVNRVETGSTFTGGTLPETTVQLISRASASISSRVLSGKLHIESFLISLEDVNVLDVGVFGMGDTLQLRDASNNGRLSNGGAVDVYVKTAPVPSSSRSVFTGTRNDDGDFEIEIPRSEFPGAYGIERILFEGNIINTGFTLRLGFTLDESAPLITETIHARYSRYQTLFVVFDTDVVPPSTTEGEFEVDVVFMPGVSTVQDEVDAVNVDPPSFDMLIKAVIPVYISVRAEVTFQQGLSAPTADELRQAICDSINGKLIGTERLLTSDIVFALKQAFPLCDVQMPISLLGKIFMPDGTLAYTSGNNFIKPPAESGISFENCAFVCMPADVDLTLTEIPLS